MLAARLFAAFIGVPADAMISIEQVSSEAEEASGLFIAVASGSSLKMRLVPEPGRDGQPIVRVLNDYDRLTQPERDDGGALQTPAFADLIRK